MVAATNSVRAKRNIPAVLGLLFVAPLVAEFLLGNLPLKLLPALIVLAPMYGGGAVIIREMVRRTNRGWPSIFLLGAAYALIEEGFVTQSLFNPDYLKMHMHLLAPAYIPVFGIGGWWTLFMLNLHAFWSIAVSIALVEALVPGDATSPWLGLTGESIVAVLFLLGSIANARFTFKQDHFIASHAQFVSVACLCGALIATAFLVPNPRLRNGAGYVPGAWIAGSVAFLLGMSVLLAPPRWGWGAFSALSFVDVIFLILLFLFSRRIEWKPLHTFSVAAGGAFAYGFHAFMETPVIGGIGAAARAGNVIFLAAAAGMIFVGAKRLSRVQAT